MAILSEAEREAEESNGTRGSHDARTTIGTDPVTGERRKVIHADAGEEIRLTPIDLGPDGGLSLTLEGDGRFVLSDADFGFDEWHRSHTVIVAGKADLDLCNYYYARIILRDQARAFIEECERVDAYGSSLLRTSPGGFPVTLHDHARGVVERRRVGRGCPQYPQHHPVTCTDDSRALAIGVGSLVLEDRSKAAVFEDSHVVMRGRSKADLYDEVTAEMHGATTARISDDVKVEAGGVAVVDGGASTKYLVPFIGPIVGPDWEYLVFADESHGMKAASPANVTLHGRACTGSRFGVRPEFIGRSTAARVLGEAPAEGGAAPALER